jgi:hypothetical protein
VDPLNGVVYEGLSVRTTVVMFHCKARKGYGILLGVVARYEFVVW